MTASAFTLGVILLDTRFPRHPGEVGNPASFPFAIRYRRVPAATVASVVTAGAPPPALAAALIEAGRALVAEGADMVVTSCGFLTPLQAALEAALPVPVLTSALLLLPELRARHGPEATLGVLTFDARKLGPAQLGALAGGPLAVAGLETGEELYPAISQDRDHLDPARAEADARDAARRLRATARRQGGGGGGGGGGGLAAVVLECTNLSPYRAAIETELGLPVADLVQAVLRTAAARRPGPAGPPLRCRPPLR